MPHILSIDQGTSSTRCLLISEDIEIVASHQLEHEQIYRHVGWVEHDPLEIWNNVQVCIEKTCRVIQGVEKVMAIGVTNQRETCFFWNKHTGKPYAHAIVWSDTRTAGICDKLIEDFKDKGGKLHFQTRTGLPISTYFSMSKILYFFQTIPELYNDACRGDALFGTMDTFIMWKLTNGAVHATDVTNASRTLLMNISTLQWDKSILEILNIPEACLPQILPSSYVFGQVNAAGHELLDCVNKVPIAGVLGDQQAALFGQVCFGEGDAKCTYGTGAFVLMNTGRNIVLSTQGLLTTVGYQLGRDYRPAYALEGSIAYSGSTIQWLRDNLQIIPSLPECEDVANSVEDSKGVFFIPAFSGLYAPHWRSTARGTIVGLTAYHNKGHITRAALEATAYQVNDVIDAMKLDSGIPLLSLKVDGGQTKNSLLMQFQSDILNVNLTRPVIPETTALGAAFAAGLAVQLWGSPDVLKRLYRSHGTWTPTMTNGQRLYRKRMWNKALNRSLDWVETQDSLHAAVEDDQTEDPSLGLLENEVCTINYHLVAPSKQITSKSSQNHDRVDFIPSETDLKPSTVADAIAAYNEQSIWRVYAAVTFGLIIGFTGSIALFKYRPDLVLPKK